jgi:uncharacterized repeat protein (TIGR01451 family)
MKLLNSLWSKLAVASLILSLCIFPIVSTNVYAQDEPGISITKTADPAQGAPSTDVTFEIVVTNTGDSTLDPVIVNDTLPAGLSYVPGSELVGGVATPPTTSDNITLTWDLGALGSSDNTTITFKAHIDAGDAGTLTNSVEAIGTPLAGDDVSDTATVDVTRLAPGINVTKTADPTKATPSTEVTFEIVVTNTGDSTLDPIIVNDTLPDGLTYVPGSGAVGGVTTEPTISANILTWDLGALDSGVSTTITFKTKIDAGNAGTLTNSVEAIGTPPAGANVSDTATADVTILSKPYWTKAEILKRSGVPGKGISHAPGLQKPFNPNSKAAENAGKKDKYGEEEQLQIRQRTENQGNANGKLKIRQMTENYQ